MFSSLAILHWFWPEIELAPIFYNDAVAHAAIIRRMDEIWANGGNLVDFWMSFINFGHAMLRSYQFLMHLAIWALHKTVLSSMPLERAFNICITAAAMSLPWSIYKGIRLMGLPRFEATVAAVAAVLVHEEGGYGISLTNYAYAGYGTYTSLFALLFFPFAIGWSHGLVRSGRGVFAASFAFALTFMSHILIGYFTCLWVAIDALVTAALEKRDIRRLAFDLAKYGGLCLMWTAFWFIPMAQDSLLQHHSHTEMAYKWTGEGAEKIVTGFSTGRFLDAGRLPILTALAALGLLLCLRSLGKFRGLRFRRSSEAGEGSELVRQKIAVQSVAWLALSFGPATWGGLLLWMPFSPQIHWHRAFAIAQLAYCLCVGVAVPWIWRWLNAKESPMSVAAGIAMCAALVYPCLKEREQYFEATNHHWVQDAADGWNTQFKDYQAALDFALKHRDARYDGGNIWTWGNKLLMTTYIPFYGLLTQFNVENIGAIHHHQSHTETFAFHLDWKNRDHYELANVRYVALERNAAPPAGYKEILRTPNSILYDNGNVSGYFIVGSEGPAGCADNDGLICAVDLFLKSPLLPWHVYPVARLQGDCRGEATVAAAVGKAEKAGLPASAPGAVLSSSIEPGPNSDLHKAKVRMDRAGLLVFKMNYHPGWKATVDGRETGTKMVLPAFTAIPLGAGTHEVSLAYVPAPLKTALLWICFPAILLLMIGSHVLRLKRGKRAAA